jgi:hypothetical protein
VSDGVLEAVDPAASPDSSAQAIPLFQPVRAAAATPKTTARPPTRLAYALPGMRYVYRLTQPARRKCDEFRSSLRGRCGKFTADMWSVLPRALIVAAAMSLAFASPAAADPASYLHEVQPFYNNFSVEQLLSEGLRVCSASRSGMKAPDAVQMVQNDIGASVAAAGDIVAAAVVHLDC